MSRSESIRKDCSFLSCNCYPLLPNLGDPHIMSGSISVDSVPRNNGQMLRTELYLLN